MRLKFSFLFMLSILIMGFFISIPYQNIVSATYTYHVVTFETPASTGNPYSDSFITSVRQYAPSANFAVKNSGARTGSQCFYVNAEWGWFNMTYDKDDTLTKFEIYYYQGGTSATEFYFSNRTRGWTTPLIQMSIQTSSDYQANYYNSLGTKTKITDSFASSYRLLSWEYHQLNYTVRYQYNTVVKWGTARQPVYLAGGERIDCFMINGHSSNNYIDDMNITTNGTISGGGGAGSEIYCGIDVSAYPTQIGNIYGVTVFSEKSSEQITSNYGVPLSTTIHGVGLAVDINQYLDDPDPSNYTLKINNNTVGGAECFTPFSTTTGSFYILFWDCSVVLENETPTFSYVHNQTSPYGWNWCVGQSSFSDDLDDDGDSYFTYEESTTFYSWVWLNLWGIRIPFWLPTTTTFTGVDADLGMTFWAGTIQPPTIIDYNYTDTLGLSNWDYKNDTGYVYTIPKVQQGGIVVSYTIASGNQAEDYGILIHFTNATESGYPFECGDFTAHPPIPYPDGVYSCIPTVAGKYKFCLYTRVGGGIVFAGVNVTAWVVGTWANESYYIYTNPPTTYQFDGYDVVWKYDNPSSYNGAIAMFNEYLQFQEHGYLGNYIAWDIVDSMDQHTQYYNSWGDSAEYWGLFANKTNGYALACPLHQHNIKLYGIIENRIWVLPSTLAIPTADDVGNMYVVIYYQHRFVGTNIAIYIDGIYFQPVGDASSGSNSYVPMVAGTHQVALKLDQNGTLVTVASNTFRVTIAGGGGGGGGGGGIGIIPTLAQPLGSIVGMIITIFCLLTPFIIGGALHLQGGIHPVIYAMTGGLGLAISTIMGLFPVWIPLFVIVCGIIVIVIFYLRGASASSE